jgi:phage gp36-like protein
MPWVDFEPTIPAFEQAKTVRALDRAAAVIGAYIYTYKYEETVLKILQVYECTFMK